MKRYMLKKLALVSQQLVASQFTVTVRTLSRHHVILMLHCKLPPIFLLTSDIFVVQLDTSFQLCCVFPFYLVPTLPSDRIKHLFCSLYVANESIYRPFSSAWVMCKAFYWCYFSSEFFWLVSIRVCDICAFKTLETGVCESVRNSTSEENAHG